MTAPSRGRRRALATHRSGGFRGSVRPVSDDAATRLGLVGERVSHEDWFDVDGYQSGHGDAPHDLLVLGPPAQDWRTEPIRPSINLEPNFEGHLSYQGRTRFTDYHVRRAAYWSLLVAPPAGWIYANNPTWVWSDEITVPEDHPHLGPVEPWREAHHAWIAEPGGAAAALR